MNSNNNTLKNIENTIKAYHKKVGVEFYFVFLFAPLVVAIISFLYTFFGQSTKEYTTWENVYVSLLYGYGIVMSFFLIGIMFQSMSAVSNTRIRINNMDSIDPDHLSNSAMMIQLLVYFIIYSLLIVLYFFKNSFMFLWNKMSPRDNNRS